MRVGVDIRCLQDAWRTGVGEYTLQTLRHLVAASPDWGFSGYSNSFGKYELPRELPREVRVQLNRLPNKLNNLRLWLGVGRPPAMSLGSAGPADVIWFPNPLFSSFDSTPTVQTVHDLALLRYPGFFPRRGLLWYVPMVRNLLKRSLPDNAAVVAVSKHTALDLLELYPRWQGRITVAYPGVEERFFTNSTADDIKRVRDKYHLPDSYLLSLGTIEPRKNYDMLLRAFESYASGSDQDTGLVIAGAWGWRTESFRRALSASPARRRVSVIGYVDQQDKPALYAGARLFLYPSQYEGFGMPVAEAMASGTAVVSSLSSSLPEVVGEAGVLASPLRAEQWTQAIDWLMADSASRQRYAEAGRARARDFSWHNTADTYRRVFMEMSQGTYAGSY